MGESGHPEADQAPDQTTTTTTTATTVRAPGPVVMITLRKCLRRCDRRPVINKNELRQVELLQVGSCTSVVLVDCRCFSGCISFRRLSVARTD